MGETSIMGETSENRAILDLSFPFCDSNCVICWRSCFHGLDTALYHRYLKALIGEIEASAPDYTDLTIEAIRLGSGMASLIDSDDLAVLFRVLRRVFVLKNPQILMEFSPFGVNGDKQTILRRIGISFYDLEVITLDRHEYLRYGCHDANEVLLRDLPMLHSRELQNTGVTILINERKTSEVSLRRTLAALGRLPLQHVRLVPCPDGRAGDTEKLASDTAAARNILLPLGFHEYLPGCYSRAGLVDRFAALDATGTTRVAFGLGAASYVDGIVSHNTGNLELYLSSSSDYRAILAAAHPHVLDS
ncbi:MAG: hypothetical protein LBI64_06510 [Coriobacteriales bacterium]|jgi:oxygen-independent coproporphyrinogen-3 oxidase|nr:hypothetical protein [Coriobacteriales bacterium]